MTESKTKVTRLVVKPIGQPIFCEQAVIVEIQDDAAGEFVQVYHHGEGQHDGKVGFNPEDWPAIRAAIDQMVADCEQ